MRKILPYLPLPSDCTLKEPTHNSINLSFAFKPKAFSSKFLVLDSGVLINFPDGEEYTEMLEL